MLAGGTTSTGPVQSLASLGTAGQGLISNGAGALPTFQEVVRTATVTLTAAQVNALNTTPITIVPAAGAGTVNQVLSSLVKLNYTGTAFTGGGTTSLNIGYTGPTAIITNAMINTAKNATSNQIAWTTPAQQTGTAYTNASNRDVIVYSTGAGAGGGTNTIVVTVRYAVVTI